MRKVSIDSFIQNQISAHPRLHRSRQGHMVSSTDLNTGRCPTTWPCESMAKMIIVMSIVIMTILNYHCYSHYHHYHHHDITFSSDVMIVGNSGNINEYYIIILYYIIVNLIIIITIAILIWSRKLVWQIGATWSLEFTIKCACPHLNGSAHPSTSYKWAPVSFMSWNMSNLKAWWKHE